MNLEKLLSLKTIVQEQELLSRLPDDPAIQEKISAAFDRADKIWRDRLIGVIGSDQAQTVFKLLDNEIPGATNPCP